MWCCVTSHETDAGDAVFVGVHKATERAYGELFANVLREPWAMAAWAMARAACEVDGEGGLVGDLLKDYVGVEVLQHDDELKEGKGAYGLAPLLRLVSIHLVRRS